MRILNKILVAARLKKPTPSLNRSRGDVLKSVPIRNPLVEWKKEETGEVSLIIPADRKRHLRFLIRIFHLPNKRVVALDEVASFVWEQCDGERSFEQIAQELTGKFRLTRREAEASLAEFFRVLGQRGMLGFAVPKSAREPAPTKSSAKKSPKRKRR